MKMPKNVALGKSERHLTEATKRINWRTLLGHWGASSLLLATISVMWGCTHTSQQPQVIDGHLPMKEAHELEKPVCERIITADVVSFEQVYYYNRFGSFNPAGLMYALRRDVVIDRESLDEVIQSLDTVISSLEEELQRWPEENRDAKTKILEAKKKDRKELLEEIIKSLDSDIDSLNKELTRWPELNQAANKKILEAKNKNRVELHEMLLAADKKTSTDKASPKSEQEEPEKKPEVVNSDLDLDVNSQKTSEINLPLDGKRSLDRYLAGHVKLRHDKRPRPLILRANEKDCLNVTFTNFLAPTAGGQEAMNEPEFRLTHPDKKIRAVIDGEEPATRHASMHVNGLSLVSEIDLQGADIGIESQGVNVGKNGWKDKDGKCSSNPVDFGSDHCALAAPGETRTYTWYAKKEGTYFFYSMGAPAGGEGDGGQLGLGLFGAVNVQPKEAKWYRSQVTHDDLVKATVTTTPNYGQPVINYEVVAGDGTPILNMVKVKQEKLEYEKEAEINNQAPCRTGEYQTQHEKNPVTHKIRWTCKLPAVYEIVHSDLNAVIDIKHEKDCERQGEGNACGKPYREFSVIFHDEVTAVQAFKDLDEENSPLSSLRDGMGINYGASGVGAMVVANRNKIGPARDCVECKLEEFFLTSWVNGDPAMVVGYKKDNDGNLKPIMGKDGKQVHDAKGRPLFEKEVKYPDDPSNVHHSYLGDPVRFRNMHAGPKETHVFHLHAHQWVEDKNDPTSHYLDSQTISPGATFSYEVHYGGSGNRNFGPGDSIFHCHLYPHFAQGMWEFWRTHDVFEDGSEGRRLPDAEIAEGTPNPALVPLPRTPLPPMPSEQFAGYPFYIAAEKGHRPPQAPRDLDPNDHTPGAPTLRRHIIAGGTSADGIDADEPKHIVTDVQESANNKKLSVPPRRIGKNGNSLLYPEGKLSVPPRETKDNKPLYEDGTNLSDYTARRVYGNNQNDTFFLLARQLTAADIQSRPEEGTRLEQVAMRFHAGQLILDKHGEAVRSGEQGWTHTKYNWDAPGYKTCLVDPEQGVLCDKQDQRVLFRVSGPGKQDDKAKADHGPTLGMPGAPFANPCPTHFVDEKGHVQQVVTREYRAAYIQMDMTVNKAGWHDPQARFPVLEEDVKRTLNGTRPAEPLFFRANSGECVVFKATNLIPSNLNLDDFQVYSPTDTIGQHIHLVKFDVTSSDGSGNGWNYEDGTLAADEVRERILAHNRYQIETSKPDEMPKLLEPKTHRIFLKGGALYDNSMNRPDSRGFCPPSPLTRNSGESKEAWVGRWEKWGKLVAKEHPWCGAQTTIQRWWADPLLNGKPGDKGVKDRTLRTVFTHDHFGPSSHQHHGFYAALVIEPRNSKWFKLDGSDMGGTDEKGVPVRVEGRHDGGPTSYAANIIARDEGKACLNMKTIECSQQLDNKNSIDRSRTGREFNLAFADFAIVYTSDRKEDEPLEGNRFRPVNPPNHIEGGVLNPEIPGRIPSPEGISTKDPGTQLINYRNEPIPLRIGNWSEPKGSDEKVVSPWSCLQVENGKKKCFEQKSGEKGDMAHVFSSQVHSSLVRDGREQRDERGQPIFTEQLAKGGDRDKLIGRQPGDPATPLLQAYDGDRVQIRLIQGAQEEQHVFTMHGARWFTQPDSENSGYVNAQHIGISEHFEFNDRILGLSDLPSGALGHGIEPQKCQKQDEPPCRTDLLFSSSAMDNLWDGQWGLMRIYPAEELNLTHILARLPGSTDKNPFTNAFNGPGLDQQLDSEVEPSTLKKESRQVQDPVEAFCKDPARKEFLKTFSVEAHMAKELLGENGLVYNKKFGITDPDAILFVEQGDVSAIRNGTRKPEPLILRARAGDCIEVTLTNLLPEKMPDDPTSSDWQKTWSYNMLPPIVEGFNFNQIRSSNRVGLHAALVDQNTRRHDGAHIGFNEDSTVEPEDAAARKTGQYKKSKTYLWYAGDLTGRKGGIRERPIEFGVIPLTDQGDVIKHPAHGAIGALVIEPQCSEFTMEKVKDGDVYDVYKASKAVATVTWWEPVRETSRDGKLIKAPWCPAKPVERTKMTPFRRGMNTVGSPSLWPSWQPDSWRKWLNAEERFEGVNRFREFVLLYQDALALQHRGQPLPNLRNGDDSEDSGQKAFNYRTEPLWARLGASAADEPDVMSEYNWSNVLSSRVPHEGCSAPPCDPETPIFEVDAGDPVRFRVVHPGGHPRMHSLAIFGHNWSLNPWTHQSSAMGWNEDSPTRFGATNGIGPARHLNIQTRAGGDCAVPGDYLYRTQEGFMFGGGLWGILRVNPVKDPWFEKHPQNQVQANPNACKVDLSKADKK